MRFSFRSAQMLLSPNKETLLCDDCLRMVLQNIMKDCAEKEIQMHKVCHLDAAATILLWHLTDCLHLCYCTNKRIQC